MQRRRHPSRVRRSELIGVAAGLVAGVVMVAALTMAFDANHPATSGSPAATHLPALVDPEFLPTTLTSSNLSTSGEFGNGVASSGSIYAIGAPNEEEYSEGYEHYGDVHFVDTANGATGLVWGPGIDGSGDEFGVAVAMTSTDIVVGAAGYDSEAGAVFVYSYALEVVAGHNVIATTELGMYTSPDPKTSEGGGQFGRSVAISGSLVAVGAPDENVSGVLDAGHAYIINLKTNALTQLTSPSVQGDENFGLSVAISGNEVLIGAPDAVSSADVDSGQAYLYSASTGDLVKTFVTPDPATTAAFGQAVAIDGTTAAVAGIYAGPSGPYHLSGAVYVYNLATNANFTLLSLHPTSYGGFGWSLAIDSNAILVGAPEETSNGSASAGNAYLFSSTSGALISSAFMPPNWPKLGYFGYSVALNGSDGLIVGAPYQYVGTVEFAGHAYIFHQIPLTFSSPDPLLSTDSVPGGLFGSTVSVDNGETVIGAPNETAGLGALAAGNAYWLPTSTGPVQGLTPSYIQTDARFGASVSTWGKLIVVGAPGQTAGGASDGAVYLFSAKTGGLEAMLTSPDPSPGGQFGASVATNGSTVVVGAPGEEHGAGTAYAFQEKTHMLTTYWKAVQLNSTHPSGRDPGANGEFGTSVAINGSTIVVGAPGENSTAGDVVQAGNAYVFDAANGTLVRTLTSPSPQSATGAFEGLGFGASVAISAAAIVVGAPVTSVGSVIESGYAYEFSSSTGALLHTLASLNPVAGGRFGLAVAINGGTIAVSAPDETAFGVSHAGNVYLISPSTGLVYDRYNSPEPSVALLFGDSVAIGHGGVLVAGEPGGTADAEAWAGTAYQFFF